MVPDVLAIVLGALAKSSTRQPLVIAVVLFVLPLVELARVRMGS